MESAKCGHVLLDVRHQGQGAFSAQVLGESSCPPPQGLLRMHRAAPLISTFEMRPTWHTTKKRFKVDESVKLCFLSECICVCVAYVCSHAPSLVSLLISTYVGLSRSGGTPEPSNDNHSGNQMNETQMTSGKPWHNIRKSCFMETISTINGYP